MADTGCTLNCDCTYQAEAVIKAMVKAVIMAAVIKAAAEAEAEAEAEAKAEAAVMAKEVRLLEEDLEAAPGLSREQFRELLHLRKTAAEAKAVLAAEAARAARPAEAARARAPEGRRCSTCKSIVDRGFTE